MPEILPDEPFRLKFECHPDDGLMGQIITTAMSRAEEYVASHNPTFDQYVNLLANVAVNMISCLAASQPDDFVPTLLAAIHGRLPQHRADLAASLATSREASAASVTDEIFAELKKETE